MTYAANDYNIEGATALAPALERMTQMTSLNLGDTWSWSATAAMHAANSYNIEGATALAPALERMTQMTSLNLGSTRSILSLLSTVLAVAFSRMIGSMDLHLRGSGCSCLQHRKHFLA